MKDELLTDALLRRFLLGEVDDDERQRIESLFITDPSLKERVLAIEEDLIDDYLEDSLTTAEKESFLLHYAETPKQRRKLRIAKSVKEWAVMNAGVTSEPVASKISIWNRFLASLRLQPALAISVAIPVIVAAVLVAVWFSGKLEERNQRLALDQELRRLNSPSSLADSPPNMVALALSPVSVRSGDSQKELPLGSDIQTVELRLLWIRSERYPMYRAVIRTLDSNQPVTVGDLHQENGGAIRIRLPARILTRGLHQVEVSGIAPDGTAGPSEEYRFTVGG